MSTKTIASIHTILHHANWGLPGVRPANPLKVVILTSIRDIGGDDKVGTSVHTEHGNLHMEGVVQRLVTESRPGGKLHGYIQVVGVITDDMPKDVEKFGYSVLPQEGHRWIHPLDLTDGDGKLVSEMTYNLPSEFRLLPKNDHAKRLKEKELYEKLLLAKMWALDGTIILSDHYMLGMKFLYDLIPGCVLNIHPGIAIPDHPFCFRGNHPTQMAITRAGEEEGVYTGSTLHFINEVFDDGPIIAWSHGTPVYGDDRKEQLRHRNYQQTKLPLLVDGLKHYVVNIFPHLHTINLESMHAQIQ